MVNSKVSVVCPFCLVTRTIVPKFGTDKKMLNIRVRCLKSQKGCSKLFWSKNNRVIIVPQTRTKILQDKISTKVEIIKKIKLTLDKLEKFLPLDILRSKLLELESIGEMRRK